VNESEASERKSKRSTGREHSILRFHEGLIGFNDCKSFVLFEEDDIAPFFRLQCMDRDEVGFFLLNPEYVARNIIALIAKRDWEAVGLEDPSARMVFLICSLGSVPSDGRGNLLAPLIVNVGNMMGRQVILGDAILSSREPLVRV
jgi:flagellar assembly factor FliW